MKKSKIVLCIILDIIFGILAFLGVGLIDLDNPSSLLAPFRPMATQFAQFFNLVPAYSLNGICLLFLAATCAILSFVLLKSCATKTEV